MLHKRPCAHGIHRNAWKMNSRKVISSILNRTARIGVEKGRFSCSATRGRPQDVGGKNKYARSCTLPTYNNLAQWLLHKSHANRHSLPYYVLQSTEASVVGPIPASKFIYVFPSSPAAAASSSPTTRWLSINQLSFTGSFATLGCSSKA